MRRYRQTTKYIIEYFYKIQDAVVRRSTGVYKTGLLTEESIIKVISPKIFKKLHNTDGPALNVKKCVTVEGMAVKIMVAEMYFRNGKKHKADGPAEKIFSKNRLTQKYFYIDGIRLLEGDTPVEEKEIAIKKNTLFRWYANNNLNLDKELSKEQKILRKLQIGV